MRIIKVEDLTHVYPSGKGIFDVTFNIERGEAFGYLGPNGAGKTTTIRNLMGFCNANSGVAMIDGHDCRKKAHFLQCMIGYLPGEIAFFDAMTGIEFLKFLCNMRRMRDDTRMYEMVKMFELDPTGRIKKMSKGMKQKLGIVAAFMHDPEIYILDEPSSGLDPLMQTVFLDLIETEKKRGKTILMSSHSFDEVERCCDRAGIIKDGRIVSIQDIASLKKIKRNVYIFTVARTSDCDRIMGSNLNTKRISDHRVAVEIKDNFNDMFNLLSGCNVTNMEVKPQTLENVFMKYYKKDGETS